MTNGPPREVPTRPCEQAASLASATCVADAGKKVGGDEKDGEREEETVQEREREDRKKVLNVSPRRGKRPWQGETTPSFLTRHQLMQGVDDANP